MLPVVAFLIFEGILDGLFKANCVLIVLCILNQLLYLYIGMRAYIVFLRHTARVSSGTAPRIHLNSGHVIFKMASLSFLPL